MWRWLFIPITLPVILPVLLHCSSYSSFGAPTSAGPISDSEAKTLWREGELAISGDRTEDAVNYLQRYVNRYPGSPHYLQAHLRLGRALIELGKPSQAIPILKNYLTATQNSPDSILGKIWIGQAYLDLRKFNEAFLISIEIDHLILESDPISDPLIQSLLIKAQALIGLDHPGQAIEVLEFAKNHLSNKNSPEIKGQTFLLQLKLKGKDCARLPSKDRLDEGQTRDQMDRRGLCLLEELLIYQKILGTQDPRSSERASAQITGDFDDYAKACSGPFHPPQKDNRANSIHRTANELRRYQAELAGQLKQDCSKKGDSAVELLNSWKTRVPPAMVGSLTQTTQSLEKFTSRIQ